MNSKFQQSIARARANIEQGNRLAAKMVRDIRRNKERANTNLELLLDEIVAETGIELKPENMPTIMIFVQQFLEDQKRREPDGGDGGMEDLQ